MNENNFELQYRNLVNKILAGGEMKRGRNGITFSVFSETLEFDLSERYYPLLTGRRIYYKGVLGELAAFLRQPKTIDDFNVYGCKFWDQWCDKKGNIKVDYGNKWLNWNGTNQLEELLNNLKSNPNSRRMIITSWDPSNIENLDLPCCHYSYQWYVRKERYLDMIWNQRSADVMVGLPSDAVSAATLNIIIANEVGLIPGKVNMMLGDAHIYKEHYQKAEKYLSNGISHISPRYTLLSERFKKTVEFVPEDIDITDYSPVDKISFELKV